MKKKKDEVTIRSSAAEYLIYVASVGDQQDSIEMRYEDENIWLTQKMMVTLYDVGTNTINYHIKKIFEDSELQEDSVIRKFRITAADGKSYSTNHYSLEMIIAVGFKVNSERAVQFRKWVNQIAKDYTIKGWVMDDERLKNGGSILTTEYFDRLLEQIRERDRQYCPALDELSNYINNPLFMKFCSQIKKKYHCSEKIEFSSCSWEYGWNVKFKKSGKNLCTVYPREGFFTVLVVIGPKEKDSAERILPKLTPRLREIYNQTEAGNGQKWLMIDLEDRNKMFDDTMRLIEIRRGKASGRKE